MIQLMLSLLLMAPTPPPVADNDCECGKDGVWLQVLGSGGPEFDDRRASSSYLIWVDGHARVLVDTGAGSAFNFERSGADFRDVKTILYSHFHVDHSADLPAFLKSSYFIGRKTDLQIYGPSANQAMPDTTQFLNALIGSESGAFRYLSSFLSDSQSKSYHVIPHVVDVTQKTEQVAYSDEMLKATAIAVHHGPLPALAWKVTIGDKTIAFSGDMNGEFQTLPKLAQNVNALVAHNAVPEAAKGIGRSLHMPPSVIGEIAAQAKVGKVIISHRMKRTLGKEKQTLQQIRKRYQGPVQFANDLSCFKL